MVQEVTVILALCGAAHATTYFSTSDDPWFRFTDPSLDRIFSGTVQSAEVEPVSIHAGATTVTHDMWVVKVKVDTMIRGTPADTVVVVFSRTGPGMTFPYEGDGVVMSTQIWSVSVDQVSLPAYFVRSRPRPDLPPGTVEPIEGHWLGPVSCDTGFASTNARLDHPSEPRSAFDGPDPERERLQMQNSVAWDVAEPALVACLQADVRKTP